MGKTFDGIDDTLAAFISRQHMFFVATAPSATDGHVNLSPKGLDSFRVLDRQTVVYADLIGSGVETVAHVQDNGRIVLMFCAFEGAPKILRLHGRGEVIDPGHPEFEQLLEKMPSQTGLRSFIRVHCTRVSDSCGYGVPLMEFVGDRDQLRKWSEQKGADGLQAYLRSKNAASIDGLPGITDHSSGGPEVASN